MVAVSSANEIKKAFVEWNGWGPPDSEYQISEFCRATTYTEYDSDQVFWVLKAWMEE